MFQINIYIKNSLYIYRKNSSLFNKKILTCYFGMTKLSRERKIIENVYLCLLCVNVKKKIDKNYVCPYAIFLSIKKLFFLRNSFL